MLNIAMVGHGMMGIWHSEALNRVEGAQLHTVVGRPRKPADESAAAPSVGRKPPSTEVFAGKYGYKKWTTDLDEALEDPEVDVVIIAGPPAKPMPTWQSPRSSTANTHWSRSRSP